MPEMRASEIAAAVGGTFDRTDGDPVFSDYHFDSRLVAKGGLFFALRTERNDGHRFLEQVGKVAGAGAMVEASWPEIPAGLPAIRVEDTARAYRLLASHVRQELRHVRYIGITGSVGKTTTREFVHGILSHRYRSHRSLGNWNNWQGLPFSLLKMPADAEAAVFELAMSSPGIGEIDHLAEVLRPDITAVLNVYPVHLEFLRTLDNVARGKMEINNYLGSDGVALLCGDFDQVFEASRSLKGRTLLFGRNPRNQAVLRDVVQEPGRCRLDVDFFGLGREFVAPPLTDAQAENLFAAILVAWQAGMKHVEIQDALGSLTPVEGRGVISMHEGVTLVDDTYNANPAAMKQLLTWADRALGRPRIAVLGDMLELGEHELEYHREVGRHLAGLTFDLLVTVGERARAIAEGAVAGGFPTASVHGFERPDEAGAFLRDRVEHGASMIFKASRGIALERAIEELRAG